MVCDEWCYNIIVINLAKGESILKKRNLRTGGVLILIFSLLISFMAGFSVYAEDYGPSDSYLGIEVLDVGQGLSVVITTEAGTALYDGGPRTSSSKVVSYLKSTGVQKLDYVIASHYDEDHLNGLIGAIHALDVGTVIAPNYTTDTNVYTSFMRAVEEKGLTVTYAEAGASYTLGSAVIQIMMPLMPTYQDENDYSVVVKVTSAGKSILIMGDCTTLGEGDMLLAQEDVNSDILVLGHHGSGSSTSQVFLDAVSPSIAVVSCGYDNTYGHPDQSVMDRLAAAGILLYRTDLQGDVHLFTQNGSEWTGNVPPSTDYSGRSIPAADAPVEQRTVQEAPVAEAPVADVPVGSAYVLNWNTMKFHYPDCSSVADIYPANREDVNLDRESIIQQGFEPCKRCNP